MNEHPNITIVDESSKEQLDEVRALFREHANTIESTGAKLDFQDFAAELRDLPGLYAQPKGCIMLYSDDKGQVLGVIAIKEIGERVGEVKRMFVRPAGRRQGIGTKLLLALEQGAKEKGYEVLKLDTLRRLPAALALYKKHGYAECEPYYANPHEDVVYLSKSIE